MWVEISVVLHVHFLALLSWLFQKPGWALASSQAGDGHVQEINLPRLGRKGPSAGRLLGWWREREEPLSLAGASLALLRWALSLRDILLCGKIRKICLKFARTVPTHLLHGGGNVLSPRHCTGSSGVVARPA